MVSLDEETFCHEETVTLQTVTQKRVDSVA